MEVIYNRKKLVTRDNSVMLQEQITKVIQKIVEKVSNQLTVESLRSLIRVIGLRPNTIKTKMFLLELFSFDKFAILYAYETFMNGRINIQKGVSRNLMQFRKFLTAYHGNFTTDNYVVDTAIEERFANQVWNF